MSLYPPAATPTPSNSMAGVNPPVCQNCSTSTTPLWRRDESGATLCNACGLFLKLHGRPRPISLKTDVIKSRNRVKSSTQVKRKNLFDTPTQDSTGGMLHAMHARNQAGSQSPPISPSGMHIHTMPTSGHTDGPYDPQLQYAQVYHAHGHSDGSQLQGHNLQQSGGNIIPPVRSGNNPPTIETLLAANSALRTRVTELELVNDLFRSRVSELETSEANSRRADTPRRDLELQLRVRIDELERRENEWRNKVLQLEEDLANKDGSSKKPKNDSLKTLHDKKRQAHEDAGNDGDRNHINLSNRNGSTDEPIEHLTNNVVHDGQSTTDKGEDLIRAEDILELQSNLVNGREEEINSLL